MAESLFGHLVSRFSSSPENLATESLCYILNRSQVAREAFVNLLAHLHISIQADLKYETQENSADGAIPDLVGKNGLAETILLGESKFWAGLTDHQPVTYLQRLQQSNGKLLIFFAPAQRFPTLWPELQRRCKVAGMEIELLPNEIPEIQIMKVEPEQYLVLMSWRVVLEKMKQSLLAAGEQDMVGNVIQLQGLCEQMDTTAFLPVRSEELTANVGMRIQQYCDIVDEITAMLVSENLVRIQGYKASAQRSGYRRYMNFLGHGAFLGFQADYWGKYGNSPIWLGLQSAKWTYDAALRLKLAALEVERPGRLFKDGEWLIIPLAFSINVEKQEVVKHLIEQIKEVVEMMKEDPIEMGGINE